MGKLGDKKMVAVNGKAWRQKMVAVNGKSQKTYE